MMQVHAPQQFDWANDAFVALNDPNMQCSEKWTPTETLAFNMPPSLLTQASIARFGQVTPPDELSPTDQLRNARDGSIPVEQLRNEALWPQQDQHDLQSSEYHLDEPSSKRRRTSRQAAPNSSKAVDESDAPPGHDANPQPPKRKRGRPKSQPQMVEAYTADGFPFQVSSARQSHLEKNRVAAHKCRQRKKEYINGLEGRAREFSSKNKALKENVAMLREEVLGLKNEVLRHAGCDFWAVDEYLARCAGDLLGMEAPPRTLGGHNTSQQSQMMNTQPLVHQRHDSMDSVLLHLTESSSPGTGDEFGGLDLLRDFEDDDMEDQE
jgi:hypothetical protein